MLASGTAQHDRPTMQTSKSPGARARGSPSPLAPSESKNMRAEQSKSIRAEDSNSIRVEERESTLAEERAYAFGSTFVLAPSFSLRLGREDSLLLRSVISHYGPAILIQSELQPRLPTGQFALDMAPLLSGDATRILTEDNAGGSSYISESLSLEVLHRAFGARLGRAEMELEYWPANGAITDFSVEIDGEEVGVSVTRALQPPGAAVPFSDDDAESLLRKKLRGINKSTETCINAAWSKQILHVWAASRRIASKVQAAYERFDEPELCANTVVLVTLCRGLCELFMERSRVERRRLRVPKGLKDERHLAVLADSDPCAANRRR